MSSLDYLAVALGVIALAFVLLVLLPKALVLGVRDSLSKRVQHRYPDPSLLVRVEYQVSSFGVKARGLGQWRGNGALAITRAELRFFQFLPKRELTLKLSRITGLSIVHAHLGKTTRSDLLKIEFSTDREPGAIAFWLPNPGSLKAELEALTGVRGAR